MLVQLSLGEESLAAADAGMRLLASMYAPFEVVKIRECFLAVKRSMLTSCGKPAFASVETLCRTQCTSGGFCREYVRG